MRSPGGTCPVEVTSGLRVIAATSFGDGTTIPIRKTSRSKGAFPTTRNVQSTRNVSGGVIGEEEK